MTTAIAPTSETDAADTSPRLSLIDLFLLADPIASALGDGWTKDDGTDADTIGFTHTDGRAVGVRLLWDGIAAQTYGQTHDQPGSYNTAAHFTNAEDPLNTILNAVNLRLLPALHGQRPRLRANGAPIPALVPNADSDEPPEGKPGTEAASNATPTPGRKRTVPRKAAKRPAKKPATAAAAKKPAAGRKRKTASASA